ncbi:hypothetical protein S245_030045 [Arachis hypogaea]
MLEYGYLELIECFSVSFFITAVFLGSPTQRHDHQFNPLPAPPSLPVRFEGFFYDSSIDGVIKESFTE